jgi:predicted acyltransferase
MSNWCTFVDTHVFGVRCLYTSVDPVTANITWAFDPEGLASTPTALATVLMGILCGIWLRRVAADSSGRNRRRVVAGLLLTAVMLAVAGTQLGAWLPVNKQLWTSSYAMFTAGTALILLLAWNALLATERRHRWATPFIWYGRNAIVAFFLSSLAARLLVHLKVAAVSEAASVQHVTLKAWIFANFYLSWLAPREASLLYALSVVLLWAGVCGLLYRRRIFVKI